MKWNEDEKAVLTCLRRSKYPRDAASISESVFASKDTDDVRAVRNALRRLVREGLVLRAERGAYLAEASETAFAESKPKPKPKPKSKRKFDPVIANAATGEQVHPESAAPEPKRDRASPKRVHVPSKTKPKAVAVKSKPVVAGLAAEAREVFGTDEPDARVVVGAFLLGPSNRKVAEAAGVSVGYAQRRINKIGRDLIRATRDERHGEHLPKVALHEWFERVKA